MSGEHRFRVYEVLSFPVPINMGNDEQKDALQIVDLPVHVAMFLTRPRPHEIIVRNDCDRPELNYQGKS